MHTDYELDNLASRLLQTDETYLRALQEAEQVLSDSQTSHAEKYFALRDIVEHYAPPGSALRIR